jgi:hypothetical protein
MIKTAAQIMAELPPDENEDHRQRHLRRPDGPAQPCRNAHRGCTEKTGGTGTRSGRGWCSRCYDRWRRNGDSWFHRPFTSKCTRKNCFMKGTPGHP